MKKNIDNIILVLISIIFILVFKYNNEIKLTIIECIKLWFNNLVPTLFIMYIIVDLLLNYGIDKLFKNNYTIIIIISLLLGTPSNAKYIREFYKEDYTDTNTANILLLFSYSPSPLFILSISPSLNMSMFILGYIYLLNFILYLLFRKKLSSSKVKKRFKRTNFSNCLKKSIKSSYNILILILGVICVYGVLLKLLSFIFPNHINIIYYILEMTNGLNYALKYDKSIFLLTAIVSFGGLSIHTQIKSILEDTDINYKYFLLGRIISSIPILFITVFY